MRYSVIEEVTKDGRKKLVQHCVYDNLENRVIARFAMKKDADAVIQRWKASALEDDNE